MCDLERLLEQGNISGDGVEVNLIEIHFGAPTSDYTINVSRRADNLSAIIGHNGNTTELVEFQYRDMTYCYDKSCDGQKVLRKVPLMYEQNGNTHVFVYHEEMLPGHRFPCTTDIDAKLNLTRTTYRINNRIQVIKDKYADGSNVVYVQYRHAIMVDVKKMNEDLTKLLHKLKQLRD